MRDESSAPAKGRDGDGGADPEAKVVTVPDCGHFPWLELRGELRRAVERWLA